MAKKETTSVYDELTKAVEFTNIEIRDLIVWLLLVLGGDDEHAGRVLATGLLYEHYRSLLPNDPGEFTAEQSAILGKLAQAFEDSLNTVSPAHVYYERVQTFLQKVKEVAAEVGGNLA